MNRTLTSERACATASSIVGVELDLSRSNTGAFRDKTSSRKSACTTDSGQRHLSMRQRSSNTIPRCVTSEAIGPLHTKPIHRYVYRHKTVRRSSGTTTHPGKLCRSRRQDRSNLVTADFLSVSAMFGFGSRRWRSVSGHSRGLSFVLETKRSKNHSVALSGPPSTPAYRDRSTSVMFRLSRSLLCASETGNTSMR